MATLFSRIVSGEIPCHKVAESDKFLAFLDIMPLRRGHVLVIPKMEIDYLFDMEDQLLAELMQFAKPIAHKISAHFPCKKVGVAVIGLEVPHAHVHLIPINTVADMDFGQQKLVLESEELAEIAEKLRMF
jgi:histidine triad (HIT) family protein